jgi:hypothetical protein
VGDQARLGRKTPSNTLHETLSGDQGMVTRVRGRYVGHVQVNGHMSFKLVSMIGTIQNEKRVERFFNRPINSQKRWGVSGKRE